MLTAAGPARREGSLLGWGGPGAETALELGRMHVMNASLH